jgi:membrane peptidoglycan carboxypeptidase
MQDLGVGTATSALKRLGISTIDDSADYGLSLALGSAEAKLTDMTNAYAAFANGGRQYDLTTITRIDDKFEKQVYKNGGSSGNRVMNEDSSFLISDILNDEAARAPIFGSSLNTPGYDVAVKTGTTDEARDAWTIGYAKQLAVGVWVGNNDNTPMRNGGSSMAGPIWRATMMAGLKGQKNQPFTPSSSIEKLTVCRSNGLPAVGGGTEGTYQEYFKKSAIPKGTCDVPKEPEDSDKDGVTDDIDQCTDTPANTEVDELGCPIETEYEDEETPTITDSDGDGVADTLDECEDTPLGTQVDATGCEVTTNGGGTTTPTSPTGGRRGA